ncbi:heavy metal translocating P-type ATPase [Pacificibacter marinus]|uniref:Putative copper-transporting ATPase PacS n=1 Tax=Pacificibacter marinus TaxID=658057 RepID=A0A1Y5S6T5_9RHOB|nr:heavy metal translocating P-type ATPase [Pacificibacter marinus]SEK78245.1 Cu2+-exporting ATPase [Pacificibacter marinus]SLN33772.1 putative copper-transporting ATPase PacS [Pacificibacter marinus]
MSEIQMSACPACLAAPAAKDVAHAHDVKDAKITLSLPAIHCAACISGVERELARQPGVRAARVNLTLKRAQVDADHTTSATILAEALNRVGYEAYELDAGALAATQTDRQGRAILARLAVAGFAMMNVMLLSVAVWSGASDATRDMFHLISAVIALPAIAFSAQPFFASAWGALRGRRLNMDVPISLAIVLAAGMSIFETFHSGAHAYFDAALSLTFFLLAGRYLDHRTRSVARSAAEELTALEVPRATLEDGSIVPIGELARGAIVRVVPGARVPVDGVVVEGGSELDRSLLTGETLPVAASLGTQVSAGEVNLTGPLLVQVSAAGEDSSLHRLADLVAMAETSRNRYTSLADRAARIYAPAVHLLALIAFLGWFITTGDMRHSLNIAVAVLIITCPCALGLAVPAVTTAASGRLFRAGMLIKSSTALERLAEVDTVVFDKTGTLTEGRPEPSNWSEISHEARSVVMALAAGSAHPLSAALHAMARDTGCEPAGVVDVTEVPGQGIEAQWNSQRVRLGRAAWLGCEALPQTATYLQIGSAVPIAFTFVDQLRAGAEVAVAALKAQGKDVVLLSGDAPAAVADIAARVGISVWDAECLPMDKAARVEALSRNGRKVLMVGDGLNDTAALAAAHVSISPASALEATRVVSDIVLLGQSLAPIGEATKVAVSATRRIKENFAIAAGYNMIAIPIALAGFATPLAAALAMSTSSITVSLNALRLRGFK